MKVLGPCTCREAHLTTKRNGCTKSTKNGRKPNRDLVDAAYLYMILHNRAFPKSPVFVQSNGSVGRKPECRNVEGFIIHRGHGPRTNCQKFV